MTALGWLFDTAAMTFDLSLAWLLLGTFAIAYGVLRIATTKSDLSLGRSVVVAAHLAFAVPTLIVFAATAWLRNSMELLGWIQLGSLGLQLLALVIAMLCCKSRRDSILAVGVGTFALTWAITSALAHAYGA